MPARRGDGDEEDDPATPGVVHDTVHVWVRLCESEPSNGQPATATIVSCEDGKTVTMARKPGKKPLLKDALKDAMLQVNAEGVAAVGKPLAALHEPILAPLVDFVTKEPPEFGPGKVGVLLCYGEARTGRESCLFGAEEARLQGNGNGNAAARAVPGASSDEGLALVTLRRLLAASTRLDGHTLHAGGCVLTMELLIDLKGPAADVKVAESQFAGIHLDGLAWSPLADDAGCVALSQQLCSSRQSVMKEMHTGLAARWCTVLALRIAPSDESAYGHLLYIIELPNPPLLRASGVAGLVLDDYCSIGTSYKTLTKCLSAMGSRKRQLPPLRDSKLSHLLGAALGDSNSLVHALVYAPTQRRHQAEAAAALEFAAKASAARLKPGIYAGTPSKGLVTQLQAVLVALDSPGEEMRLEMKGQMAPDEEAVERLRDEVTTRRKALAEQGEASTPEAELAAARQANARAREAAATERAEVEADTARLGEQITGVKSGEKLQEAMDTLKKSIAEEATSLKKQVEAMRERKVAAATSLSALATRRAQLRGNCPACSEQLGRQAKAYKAQRQHKQASLLYVSAIKLLEATGNGQSAPMVILFSELADLYTETGMAEEGVALYKQAYSLEKEVSGHESPLLALHLQKLGVAYGRQGKMEAASLTLEEAGNVLETAYGPDHPEVVALRQRLDSLDGEGGALIAAPSSAAAGVVSLGTASRAAAGDADADGDAGDGSMRASQMPRSSGNSNSFRAAGGAAGATLPRPAGMPVPKVPGLAIGGGGQPDDLQNFSSQRMRARLEARQAAKAREEGGGGGGGGGDENLVPPLGLGGGGSDGGGGLVSGGMPLTSPRSYLGANSLGGMALPPPTAMSLASKPESEMTLLEKKQAMFRERMAKRNGQAEAKELRLDISGGIQDGQASRGAPPVSTERTGRSTADDHSDSDSDSEVDEDVGAEAEDVALVEAQTAELAGKAGLAAQREAWAEVMDCGTELEQILKGRANQVACNVCSAKALLQAGLRSVARFKDETRVRSALAVLMLLEWCVPTCHSAFRQVIAGERWVRKLVDIVRKDATDQAIVRSTVMQLLVNWAAWYQGEPACAGFEGGCEMLRGDGCALPPAAIKEVEMGTAPPRGSPGSAAARGVPGLALGSLSGGGGLTSQPGGSLATHLGATQMHGDSADGKLRAELDIICEDIAQLHAILKECAAGKRLSALEVADAAQAAQDARGWHARLGVLLGYTAASGASTHRPDHLPAEIRAEMEKLLGQVDRLLTEWEKVAPVERRARVRNVTAQELRSGQTPRGGAGTPGGMQSPGSVLARGEINGVPLPAMTPRVAAGGGGGAGGAPVPTNPNLLGAGGAGGAGGGPGGATPRQRQLFLHNPKLLTARGGMLSKPGELQAQLSARGLGGGTRRRTGSEVTPRQGTAGGAGASSSPPDGADGERSPPQGFQLNLPGAKKSSPLRPPGGGGGGDGDGDGSDDEDAAMTRTKLAAPPPGSQSKRGPPPGMGLQLKGMSLELAAEPAQQSRRDGTGLDLSGITDSADTGDMAGESQMEWLGDFFDETGGQDMAMQLAELSQLVGGDANAPQFLQEMVMLQMQAEGWRAQWSVAMQENEDLRSRLYDTHNTLAAAGGEGASEEHWRELAMSIAKSADEEKAQILDALGKMREELDEAERQVVERSGNISTMKEQAEAEKLAADEAAKQCDHAIVQRNQVSALLSAADSTQMETERDMQSVEKEYEKMDYKLRKAADEEATFTAKLRTDALGYEQKLTEAYDAHTKAVESKSLELASKDEELQQGQQAMHQWRSQWEEELTEKNSIDAELLTLRSEFEKSSATYDREIEGLKDCLEKARTNNDEQAALLEGEAAAVKAGEETLGQQKAEHDSLGSAQDSEQRAVKRAEHHLSETIASAEEWRLRWEACVKAARTAEAELQLAEQALKGGGATASDAELQKMRAELGAVREKTAARAEAAHHGVTLKAKQAELQRAMETLRTELGAEAETGHSQQLQLQNALSEARARASKARQELGQQQSGKTNLLDEVSALKSEARDLTDAHAREVERLQERLAQLEHVHDSLDVAMAEEEAQFEARMGARRGELGGKFAQLDEEIGAIGGQHEETRAQLAEVRAKLAVGQKEREAAEELMKELREDAEAKAADVEEREGRLTAQLADIQAGRQRIESEAAVEKARRGEALEVMQADLAECSRKQKEAAERASEFEKQWVAESKLRKDLHNQLQELVGNLRVYCRVRPPLPAEADKGEICVGVTGSDAVVLRDLASARHDEKRFEFTQVYGPASQQEEVFADTEPLMTSVLDGFNVCIFAYGQSGTGKTFTMDGTDEKPGLVPRAMGGVFSVIGERQANFTHECFLSMIEIYNENIRDLLADSKEAAGGKRLEIMRDTLVGMYVKDCTSEPVHTASHCRTLIKQGNATRTTTATGLNDQSSRSHMLVTLTVRTTDLHTGDHYVGKLSLVDLAGSERLAKSQTSGQALKETQAINKSLSALGTVIAALATQEKHVPYRDSKLTYLLQDSLGGNSKTLMFVNIGPSQYNHAESLNSLNFASRAKAVALGKATKNREALEETKPNKLKTVTTTMAAVKRLGDGAGGKNR